MIIEGAINYMKRFFAWTLILIIVAVLNSRSCFGTEANFIMAAQNIADSCESQNGPTVFLISNEDEPKQNPTSHFMYFVPLISPTLVDSKTSTYNEQQSKILSRRISSDEKSFYVFCEFKMYGKGFHQNKFDSDQMIKRNADKLKKGDTLKNILDYIKFEGDGFGSIEVVGKIDSNTQTVTEVTVHFNGQGQESPVTIGLYSIQPVNGEYKYENRFNRIVARVNTLTFKRSENIPRMGIKIDSVNKEDQPEGMMGDIKGWLANFFIKPIEIDKIGNDTMLNLGFALFKKEPTFTFPKARNLKKEAKP